jgi:hypothetical protein
MRGLVLDINVQGHGPYLLRLFDELLLTEFWEDLAIPVLTVPELGYPQEVSDRVLWGRCQRDELVLLTENRNNDGPDSLEQTILDEITADGLPVLTFANKDRFEHDHEYALAVAEAVLNVLHDIKSGKFRGIGRLYIPLKPVA